MKENCGTERGKEGKWNRNGGKVKEEKRLYKSEKNKK